VIEFAPRVGGGLAFREIKILTGFDLVDAVIDSYLGKEVNAASISQVSGKASVVHFYGGGGIFSHIEGMEQLLEDGTVEEFHLHKTPGMPLCCADLSSRNRVLGAIIRFESEKDIEARIRAMLDRLTIINSDGLYVLVRNIFN